MLELTFAVFQAIEGQHGSLLALGYLLGHLLSVDKRQVGDLVVEDMDVDGAEDKQLEEIVSKAVKKIGKFDPLLRRIL